MNDVKFAFRQLLKNPGFTAVAVLTLALGIGANTAIFTVVNGVLLKPLPFVNPDRLVWGEAMNLENRSRGGSVSPPDFVDYRRQTKSFERIAAFQSVTVNSTEGSEPERLNGALVSAGFFETLGIQPLSGGRTFQPPDEARASDVVVLSEALWKRRFGGDPGVIGKTIRLNERASTVVGIMPGYFKFPIGADLWAPLSLDHPEYQVRRFHFLKVVGRLMPGMSLTQAQAETDQIARALEKDYPNSNRNYGLGLTPLADQIVGETKTSLLLLTAAVGLLLLITCANVANLMFVRGLARTRDHAIRAALGASRWNLARPLLIESLLLAALGGGLGLGLASASVRLLVAFGPTNLPRVAEVSLDWTVLVYATILSFLTGLVFGVVPAFAASRPGLAEMLKDAAKGSAGLTRQRFQRFIVVGEVAMSLVLLVGAGLLGKSLWRLANVSPGFQTAHVLGAEFALFAERYRNDERRLALFRELIERVQHLPGVISAGTITELPLSGRENDTGFRIEGRAIAQSQAGDYNANQRVASLDYFRAMGIPLLRGRVFSDQDTANSPRAVVISESFAKRFFPNEDAIGQRLTIDFGEPWSGEIIGVVGSIRHSSLTREPYREMYTCIAQRPPGASTLVVRAEMNSGKLMSAIREQMRQLDSSMPLFNVERMEQRLGESLAQPRFRTVLLGLFAGAAVLLVMIGIHGVLAQGVVMRTRELGIRMALGAQTIDVLGLIVRQGVQFTLMGLAIGVLAALALMRIATNFLYEVKPTDPLTFACVSVLLLGVALLACWLPARRAAKVDPMEALRYE
jgi:putative ABC transport system permease protein